MPSRREALILFYFLSGLSEELSLRDLAVKFGLGCGELQNILKRKAEIKAEFEARIS